jgi:hypothetical protein
MISSIRLLISSLPGAKSSRWLGSLLVVAAAVLANGCAGAKIEPEGQINVPTQTTRGRGVFWMQGAELGSGVVTFEILKQEFIGGSNTVFEVIPTCEGMTIMVREESIIPCRFEVAAKAGMFSAGLRSTLVTEWRFAGGSTKTLTNRVEMG